MKYGYYIWIQHTNGEGYYVKENDGSFQLSPNPEDAMTFPDVECAKIRAKLIQEKCPAIVFYKIFSYGVRR